MPNNSTRKLGMAALERSLINEGLELVRQNRTWHIRKNDSTSKIQDVKIYTNKLPRLSLSKSDKEKIVIYVWLMPKVKILALPFNKILRILGSRGHIKTNSWNNGYYTIPNIPPATLQLLSAHQIAPGGWEYVLFKNSA